MTVYLILTIYGSNILLKSDKKMKFDKIEITSYANFPF